MSGVGDRDAAAYIELGGNKIVCEVCGMQRTLMQIYKTFEMKKPKR